MRQTVLPNYQALFPFLGSMPSLMSLFQVQPHLSSLEPSISAIPGGKIPALKNCQERTSAVFRKAGIDSEDVIEIKQEDFTTKKEDPGMPLASETVVPERENEGRATMWTDTMRHMKMFNPLLDYNMLGSFFFQQASFIKEMSSLAANLQLFQKNGELSTNLKAVQLRKPEKVSGYYTKEQRLLKIQYYKEKKQKWRANHPINRGFIGRKMVAKAKPRIRGKFVKKAIFDDFKTKSN